MATNHKHLAKLVICLFILALVPNISEARKEQDDEKKEFLPGERSPNYPTKGDRSKTREKAEQGRSRKDRDRHSPPPRPREQQPPERREPSERKKPRKDRDRHVPPPRSPEHYPPKPRGPSERKKPRKEGDRHSPPPRRPEHHPPKHPERSDRYPRKSKSKHHPRSKHDRHYDRYSRHYRRHPHHRHETYRYHTRYLAPIRLHFHPIGFRLTLLPRAHIRIIVHGLPYFYFGGVFYRHHTNGYIVVRAPIGAVVSVLPHGFITFSVGGVSYYYANDTYYLWDDDYEAYVVVEKPSAADEAITRATEGRLFVYPNHGQTEEQQANDRYECHRWAVHESHVDPTLEEDDELSPQDRRNYKRAISACLEGRGYTVK